LKKLFVKTAAFVFLSLLVLCFVAEKRDRIQESGRNVYCSADLSGNDWSGSFKTNFPGFSAMSFQLVSPCPAGSGPWKIELCKVGGNPVAAAVQNPALLNVTPLKLCFPEGKAGEWRLVVHNSGPIPGSCRDLQLKCIFMPEPCRFHVIGMESWHSVFFALLSDI
jgi:hypothetical protein